MKYGKHSKVWMPQIWKIIKCQIFINFSISYVFDEVQVLKRIIFYLIQLLSVKLQDILNTLNTSKTLFLIRQVSTSSSTRSHITKYSCLKSVSCKFGQFRNVFSQILCTTILKINLTFHSLNFNKIQVHCGHKTYEFNYYQFFALGRHNVNEFIKGHT